MRYCHVREVGLVHIYRDPLELDLCNLNMGKRKCLYQGIYTNQVQSGRTVKGHPAITTLPQLDRAGKIEPSHCLDYPAAAIEKQRGLSETIR